MSVDFEGPPNAPISYVFREHQLVDAAMHIANYKDHDKRLINTTVLAGPWFELDNQRVYEEFKALILKGPGWSFIKTYDRTKNSRGAVLALRRQCEGTSAVQSRKASAYAKISSARYSGQKRAFTFDNYVEAHQDAHNTLEGLNEPVPETKKVTDFLAGITDPRLANTKDLILGDPQKLKNFELCQQYLKTLVYNKTTQEKHERQISSIGREHGKGGRHPDGQTPRKGGNVITRTYSREEWSKLTKEERDKVKQLRRARKRVRYNNYNTPGTDGARNVSGTQRVDSEDDDSSYNSGCMSIVDDDNAANISSLNKNEPPSYPSSPPTRRSGRLLQD